MKKLLAILLIALLVASTLISCGKKRRIPRNTEKITEKITETIADNGNGDGNNVGTTNNDNDGNGGNSNNNSGESGNNSDNGDNNVSGDANDNDDKNDDNNSNDNTDNGGDTGSGDNSDNNNNTENDENGGTQDENTPQPISNIQDLTKITLNGNYYLTEDVDLNGAEWTPIGDDDSPFTGTFNGNGYTISNVTIHSNLQHVGFFGYNEGTIENLKLTNVTINATNDETTIYVGALVGKNTGTVKQCYTEGSISGTVSVSNETNEFTSAAVVGGLMGYMLDGNISECGSSCTITATSNSNPSYAGGLIGFIGVGTVTNSYAHGNVFSYYNSTVQENDNSSAAGGLAAHNSKGTVTNCYASGNITTVSQYVGHSFSGALIGSNMNTGIIENCYALGNVTSQVTENFHSNGGALCGYVTLGYEEATVKNSYYSSIQEINTLSQHKYGTEKALNEIQTVDFHISTLKWSSQIWSFTEGALPTLKALA